MNNIPSLATIVHADVDWLSMSAKDPSACRTLLEWRDKRFSVLADGGWSEKRFSGHGYQYRQRGQVAIGVGRCDVVAQLSGAEASAGWRDLARLASNVSRVDLACTARTDTRTDALAEQEYAAATARKRGRGRAAQVTLIKSEDRGDTLYVGSRKSDQLGRLYNKEKESRQAEYSACWRWEVQYRRSYALSTVRALQATPVPSEAIIATVGRWFTDRGVRAAYRSGVDPLCTGNARPAPDDQRWLAWVRRCVQPRAKEMVERYGWRYVAESCVGHISTYEEWESLVRGLEFEFEEMEANGGG